MIITEVHNTEVNRIDLFLIRTMGADTAKNRALIHYLNPSADFTNFRASLRVVVPEEADIRRIKCLKCYFLNRYIK